MADTEDTPKIVINRDEILTKHSAWATGEVNDSSNVGTRREAIGGYCETNGIENKAFSQFRAGMKIKNDGKRRDWVRSLQLLLPVAEGVVFGNQNEMDLTEGDVAPEVEPEAQVEGSDADDTDSETKPDDEPAELAEEYADDDKIKAFSG